MKVVCFFWTLLIIMLPNSFMKFIKQLLNNLKYNNLKYFIIISYFVLNTKVYTFRTCLQIYCYICEQYCALFNTKNTIILSNWNFISLNFFIRDSWMTSTHKRLCPYVSSLKWFRCCFDTWNGCKTKCTDSE